MSTRNIAIATLSALSLVATACGGAKPRGPLVLDPNLVSFEGAASNQLVLAETPAEILVRLRISTPEAIDNIRPALNLALVIDTSGSMEGEAIENARRAAAEVVQHMRDGDRLAVIAFHSDAELVIESSEISSLERAAIVAKIAAIEARGTTSLSQGLAMGLNEIQRHHGPESISRIVLLSDGIPNRPEVIPQLIAQAKQSSIPVTALGFGLDYDESLLTTIAQGTGGGFHYIEEADQVAAVFVEEVTRLHRVVAQNMILRLVPGPGLSVLDVWGADVGHAAGEVQVGLGDISQGERRDIVVRLSVRGRRDGAVLELLDAHLTFQDAVAGAGALERKVFVSARSSADAAAVAKGRDMDVELSAARAAAAAATVRAVALARAGQLQQAQELLAGAEKAARQAVAEFDQDAELAALVKAIAELNEALPGFVNQVQPQPAASLDYADDGAPAAAESMSAPAARRQVNRSHDRAIQTLQGR